MSGSSASRSATGSSRPSGPWTSRSAGGSPSPSWAPTGAERPASSAPSSGCTPRARAGSSWAASTWPARPTGQGAGCPSCPQRVSLPGMLTAREILALFARLKKAPLERVDEVLEEFALGDSADRRTAEFSGGMLQRLGLAVGLPQGGRPARPRRAHGEPRPPGHPEAQPAPARPEGEGHDDRVLARIFSSNADGAGRPRRGPRGRAGWWSRRRSRSSRTRSPARPPSGSSSSHLTDDMIAAAREAGGDVSGHNGREVSFTALPRNAPAGHPGHRAGRRRDRGVPHRRPRLGGADPGAPRGRWRGLDEAHAASRGWC